MSERSIIMRERGEAGRGRYLDRVWPQQIEKIDMKLIFYDPGFVQFDESCQFFHFFAQNLKSAKNIVMMRKMIGVSI